jgi:hypothetical protein
MRLVGTIALIWVLILMPVATAVADPDTGRVRVLDCGPSGSLTVVLNPYAFSSSVPAFHDVSSNAVLVPLDVRVNGLFILRSAPGVLNTQAKRDQLLVHRPGWAIRRDHGRAHRA